MLDILDLRPQLQQKLTQEQKQSRFVDQHFPNCFDSSHGNGNTIVGNENSDKKTDLPPSAEKLVARKLLPEKGKLLQAVMEAGPLLQTLLLAGPLPQWQHPPPRIDSIEIPPMAISPPSTHNFLRQDSLVSVRREAYHTPLTLFLTRTRSTRRLSTESLSAFHLNFLSVNSFHVKHPKDSA